MEILEVAFHNVVTGNTSFVALVALVKLFQLSVALFAVRSVLAARRWRKGFNPKANGNGYSGKDKERHWEKRANAQSQPQPALTRSDSAFTGGYSEEDWGWIASVAGCQTIRS